MHAEAGDFQSLLLGRDVTIIATLTGNYQRRLVAGRSYALVWPGPEIAVWAPGSVMDHRGEVLESQYIIRKTKLPRLVLPR
ncbi:hypothetical protein PG996_000501 [Apiospora saccharicola]|uniref:Uncharacterized protein n=1 Tax=Apiospora saccharicola TaxID=335842 RepID=A0ABR1WE09_9PEZI